MQQQTANATAIREHIFSLVFNSTRNPGSVARFDLTGAAPVNVPILTDFIANEVGFGVWMDGKPEQAAVAGVAAIVVRKTLQSEKPVQTLGLTERR